MRPVRVLTFVAAIGALCVLPLLWDAPETGAAPETDVPKKNPKSNLEALNLFVDDPSLPVRCSERADEGPCAMVDVSSRAIVLPMTIIPNTAGETTDTMVLTNTSQGHHPIFEVYAKHVVYAQYNSKRLLEFNGVHTAYSFDCQKDVDFRRYHQVRAAMCLEHERMRKSDVVQGMLPIVDEEYMEYVMTLVTAYDAASRSRPFTAIELGARYGTWIVRAGASYVAMGGSLDKLNLVAVEGNCHWFRKMQEHVRCNGLQNVSKLILAYAAPESYNKVLPGDPQTYKLPRAVSILQLLLPYDVVDFIDFDIQGFEWIALEETGVLQEMSKKVAFAHFGTHGTDIEERIAKSLQRSGWCVIYHYAGAHTKRLNHGHSCETPYGRSVFNDGALGIANKAYYPQLKTCPEIPHRLGGKGKKAPGSRICYEFQSRGILMQGETRLHTP